MKAINKISTLYLLVLTLVAISCGRRDSPDPDPGGGGNNNNPNEAFVTMNVDGESWTSRWQAFMSGGSEAEGLMIQIEADNKDKPEATNGHLILRIHLPMSKLDDPRGTYDIVAIDPRYNNQNEVWSYFQPFSDYTICYRIDSRVSSTYGRLTITGFERANTLLNSYSRLEGTFEMSLVDHPWGQDRTSRGRTMNITNGKFKIQ